MYASWGDIPVPRRGVALHPCESHANTIIIYGMKFMRLFPEREAENGEISAVSGMTNNIAASSSRVLCIRPM